MKYLSLVLVLLGFQVVYGHYQGPFLLWGVEDLNDMKIPALQTIDDQNLRNIYSKASTITIFIKNSTIKLNEENFPKLSNIVNKNEWLYLPQETLSLDPTDYNVNIEVIPLTGSAVTQDSQIAEYYRNAQDKYGNKNILGILAEGREHLVSKREATNDVVAAEPDKSFIYEAKGEALLYTSEAPILSLTENGITVKHELTSYETVTAVQIGDEFIMTVNFVLTDKIIAVRFTFYLSGGNWYLNYVKYGDQNVILNVIGTRPSAPYRMSYACGDTIVYKSDAVSLTLKGIQVQPLLNGATQFGRAYDCTGFMSAPILAGLFIVSILLFVLTIAITAIMDIKTPTRFENRHSKPLTFNVQE